MLVSLWRSCDRLVICPGCPPRPIPPPPPPLSEILNRMKQEQERDGWIFSSTIFPKSVRSVSSRLLLILKLSQGQLRLIRRASRGSYASYPLRVCVSVCVWTARNALVWPNACLCVNIHYVPTLPRFVSTADMQKCSEKQAICFISDFPPCNQGPIPSAVPAPAPRWGHADNEYACCCLLKCTGVCISAPYRSSVSTRRKSRITEPNFHSISVYSRAFQIFQNALIS